MCLGIVMKIEEINGKEAIANYYGNRRKVRLDIISDSKVGDYILIHAGFAISKLTEEEGEERMELLKELDEKMQKVNSK